MQSRARASGPQPSGSHPAGGESKDQAQNLTGREVAPTGSATGHWLNRARRWLNQTGRSMNSLIGRSGATAGSPAAVETDSLLAFASETQTAQGSLNEVTRAAPPRTRFVMGWALLALAVIVVVASIGTIGVSQLHLTAMPSFAVKDARVSIETRPPAAQVLIDGQSRGVTPIVVMMKPGAHTMVVRAGLDERVVPLSVAAGAEVAQYFEMKAAEPVVVVGRMSIVTDPAGAHVSIDGRPVGVSPVTALELPAAEHKVTVTSETGSAERTVTVEAGAATSVVFSLPKVSAPFAGWLTVSAPFDVQIMEGTDVIGSGGASKVMLAAGRHDVLLVNRTLEYQETRKIDITPGKVTSVRVDPPKAMLSANARPWADVWLDGNSVGQTPISNLAVPIGTHQVLFRHPQLGERRENVVVNAKGPNRVAADFSK
jgi:hypothetical protein